MPRIARSSDGRLGASFRRLSPTVGAGPTAPTKTQAVVPDETLAHADERKSVAS
jgi:hypothetical protein